MPNYTQDDSRDGIRWEKPVSWLLGRQLIASLKSTLLYTAFGTKIDARDWMVAKVFPAGEDVAEAWKNMYVRDTPKPGEKEVDFTSDDGEFWFDYISDTGDGMTATYSIAYLCLSDLWVPNLETSMPSKEPLYVRLRPGDQKGLKKLPRGEFLLVGGDTSYHMADYASLHLRFQLPFRWAYEDARGKFKDMTTEEREAEIKRLNDLTKAEKAAEEAAERAKKPEEIKRLRPLFGIPGNHDYYDMLDGFRRQFRVPPISRTEDRVHEKDSESSQLQIPGFRRQQETSYIALRLPFDWMLWGLDTEVGKIDERQREFFKRLPKSKNMIVCTSAPTTVFGKFADKNDEKSGKAFLQLELPRPFLRSLNVRPTTPEETKERDEDLKENQLPDTEIRLDLAGDVHHYARYWGPSSPNTQPTRNYSSDKQPLARTNYASVMSGLGGAFHHPSTTYVDEIREQALYPQEDTSREHVAGQIFNPWRVMKGGGVWFLGGLLGLILAFAAIAGDSSRPAIHNFKPFIAFGLTEPDRYAPTISSNAEAVADQAKPRTSVFTKLREKLGYTVAHWTPEPSSDPECQTKAELAKPLYLWGKCRTEWPAEYSWGFWLVILTVPAMILAIVLMGRLYRAWDERVEVLEEARKPEQTEFAPPAFDNNVHVRKVNVTIGLSTFVTALLAVIGMLLMMPYRTFITPFGNSLLVLLSICWAGVAMYMSLKYSDWLFEQASKRAIRRRDWAITWVFAALAVFGMAIGVWVFGKNNVAAYLIADTVFVLVLLAIPILLAVAGWKLAGAHQKGLGKVSMVLVGLWHALLQLGVGILLIKKGTWLTVFLAVIAVLIFWVIGKALMRRNWRKLLALVWVVFGVVMLTLPAVVYKVLFDNASQMSPQLLKVLFWPHTFSTAVPFSKYEWWFDFQGWWQIFPILLAGVFFAFLSCVWLGWYLGVSLGFNGHNNEAGGAARIEKFKQLIRFRLQKDKLTGYVIAIDDPQRFGRELHPRIVDIFHLTSVEQKP